MPTIWFVKSFVKQLSGILLCNSFRTNLIQVYSRHVARGEIVKYTLETFEDNSNNGQLNVTIRNTAVTKDGKSTGQNAQFVVGIVNCSKGILTPPAIITSLKSGATKSMDFNVSEL